MHEVLHHLVGIKVMVAISHMLKLHQAILILLKPSLEKVVFPSRIARTSNADFNDDQLFGVCVVGLW